MCKPFRLKAPFLVNLAVKMLVDLICHPEFKMSTSMKTEGALNSHLLFISKPCLLIPASGTTETYHFFPKASLRLANLVLKIRLGMVG
jgi:hypothetical protein